MLLAAAWSDQQAWLDQANVRAALMAKFPDYFERVNELAEAEEYYITVKNTKKSNPAAYYEGRDRVFRARWGVKNWEDDHAPQVSELHVAILRKRSQDERDAFLVPENFAAWLRKQVQSYGVARQYPERITSLCVDRTDPATLAEIAYRHDLYVQLNGILEESGPVAAVAEWLDTFEVCLTANQPIREECHEWDFYDDQGKRQHGEQWHAMYLVPTEISVSEPKPIKPPNGAPVLHRKSPKTSAA